MTANENNIHAVSTDGWPNLCVAVTGSLGSGKSTVTGLFGQKGLPVIDCDRLARKVTAGGTPGIDMLVKALGHGLLLPDNTLNRQLLLEIILDDPASRARLEAVVHPLVLEEMNRQLQELASSGHETVVVEVPLLFEVGWHHLFQLTVMVIAPESICIERIMARNRVSREMAHKWMELQMDQEAKEKMADFIIRNDGDMAQLEQRVTELWKKIRAMEGRMSLHEE